MRPVRQFDERLGMRLRGQVFYLRELGFGLLITPQGTQEPAQTVVAVRLGRVNSNRLAEMSDRPGGIAPISEDNAEIEMRQTVVLIQNQRLPQVRFGGFSRAQMHLGVTQIK